MRPGDCDENVEEGERPREDRHQEEVGEAAGAGQGLQRRHDDCINGHKLSLVPTSSKLRSSQLVGSVSEGAEGRERPTSLVSYVDHFRCQQRNS